MLLRQTLAFDPNAQETVAMQIFVCDPAVRAQSLNEMQFEQLAGFNSAHIGVFWSEPGGPGPWEMHPDSEEVLQVLEGEIELEVLPQDGGAGVKTSVPAGSFVVVPKGCWHRHVMVKTTQEMYISPALTEHSMAADPR